MPLNPVPGDAIRDALRPSRADPARFEAEVRGRLGAALRRRDDDPLAGLSPFLRGAAALLPLPFFTGCRASGAALGLVPASWGVKLLGYLAFPAVSLFVLLGATIFGVAKIRGIQRGNLPDAGDDAATLEAVRLWWRRHRWAAGLVFAATLALMWVGATWLLFLTYIVSFGVVVYVLASFAGLGLGNRPLIGQSCVTGLMFLGQLAAGFPIGDADIHFVDRRAIAAVFFVGAMVVLACLAGDLGTAATRRFAPAFRWAWAVLLAITVVPLVAWYLGPILRPATPSRVRAYVESFDEAPFGSASWHRWEIAARWAVEAGLAPDLSGARGLLAREIAGEQNPFILGDALSVGLVRADRVGLLRDYPGRRRALVEGPAARPIPSLPQEAWVIRASALLGDLTDRDRDFLEARLLATLDRLAEPQDVIAEARLATGLLAVIGRPVEPSRDRERVHGWLRKLQSKGAGGFQLAGGFRAYASVPTGSLDTTEAAVELMGIYGVPAGLDLNWVRSFLKPMSSIRLGDERWLAAVALDRLNRLPGVRRPTWPEVFYAERSLIAAVVLAGLCVYATLSSPRPAGPRVLEAPAVPGLGRCEK